VIAGTQRNTGNAVRHNCLGVVVNDCIDAGKALVTFAVNTSLGVSLDRVWIHWLGGFYQILDQIFWPGDCARCNEAGHEETSRIIRVSKREMSICIYNAMVVKDVTPRDELARELLEQRILLGFLHFDN
jgi:hypothetical protein